MGFPISQEMPTKPILDFRHVPEHVISAQKGDELWSRKPTPQTGVPYSSSGGDTVASRQGWRRSGTCYPACRDLCHPRLSKPCSTVDVQNVKDGDDYARWTLSMIRCFTGAIVSGKIWTSFPKADRIYSDAAVFLRADPTAHHAVRSSSRSDFNPR